MKTLKIITLLIITLSISGCQSILSDRSKCPCYLTFEFSALAEGVKYLYIWVVDNHNQVVHSDYILADNYKNSAGVPVPRGSLKVYAWANAGINTTIYDLKSSNSTLITTQNKADSLFSYTKEINTNKESIADTIMVRAEFATLEIKILNAKKEDSLRITINNTTKGFFINRKQIGTLGKLTPNEIKTKDGAVFICSILRQEEMLKDLTLNIDGVKNGQNYNAYTYPLGRKLIESGYDMSSTRLKSISITINSALSLIKLNSLGWEYINNQEIKL